MTKSEDISYRARSVARVVDRLKPGKYLIELTWPQRHHGEPFEIKVEDVDLTNENEHAIKPVEGT